MRKLLILAMLAFGTLAWAQAAAGNVGMNQEQTGNNVQQRGSDWYNQKLSAQADELSLINGTVAPSKTAALAPENLTAEQLPPSMAANFSPNESWYAQRITAEAAVNQRKEAVIKSSPGFVQESGALPEQ